ncbi:MAG: ABC transporter permease [Streptosporangiaceae bacterium]
MPDPPAPISTGILRPSATLRDTLTLTSRSLRLTARNLDAMFSGMLLPIFLLLLFVYLLGGAIHTGISYVTYVVPGVAMLCAGYIAAQTAISVSHDLTGGVMARLRSMDISGVALLTGHVVACVLRDIASTILVFAVAFAIGFRATSNVLSWLAAAGILILYMAAISWVAAAIGLVTKSPEAAGNATFIMMFLPYLSGAFVPISSMPAWIRGFAAHEPLSPIINSFRGLLLGTPTGNNPLIAIAWCAGIMLAAALAASLLFRRHAE